MQINSFITNRGIGSAFVSSLTTEDQVMDLCFLLFLIHTSKFTKEEDFSLFR